MWVSGVPQLQVIHMEYLYGYKCMIDGLPLLYWRRNLGKSGQDSILNNVLNTMRLCSPGLTKSHVTLDSIVGLGMELHTTLGEIA